MTPSPRPLPLLRGVPTCRMAAPPTLCTQIFPRKVSHSAPNTLYPDIPKEGQSLQHSVPGYSQGRSVTCQGRSVTPTLCTRILPRKVSHSHPNTLYPDVAKEGQSPQHSVPGYCRGRSVTVTPIFCTRILPRKVSQPNPLYLDITKEGRPLKHSVPGHCLGRSVIQTSCTRILPKKVSHSAHNTLNRTRTLSRKVNHRLCTLQDLSEWAPVQVSAKLSLVKMFKRRKCD